MLEKTVAKKSIRLVIALAFVVSLCLSLFGWSTLRRPLRYPLTTTAAAAFGRDGGIILIDQGKTAIEFLNREMVLEKQLFGEKLDDFYFAEKIAQTADGTLYIADRAYVDAGQGIETAERVLERRGGASRTVWEQTLEGADVSAEQRTAIFELQCFEESIWFLRGESYGVGLYRFSPGGEASLVRRAYCGDVINDASIDLETGTIAIATRRGYVRVLHENDRLWRTVSSDAEHLMPRSITARNGSVWFSDVFEDRICRFDAEFPEKGFETIFRGDSAFVDLQASADGGTLLAGNGAGFYRIDAEGSVYIGEISNAHTTLTVLLRICLGFAALIALCLLAVLLRTLVRLLRTESALRVLLVILAAASVSSFVAFSMMNDLFAQEDASLVENMKLFAESLLQGVEEGDLRSLQWEEDYGSSAYARARRPMDNMLALAHAENNYYRYVLYRMDGENLRLIFDSDDSAVCGQPYEMSGGEYIAEVQRTGKAYALQTKDADGNRIEVLIPVAGEEGEPYAVLEISLDLSLRNRERAAAKINMVLNVVCATAVVVMLILELLFHLAFLEKKRTELSRRNAVPDPPALVPVRSLMFLIYTADCMQEAFIAVLSAQLYRGGLPLSDSAAAALPISAEVFAMAVSSAIAGRGAQRYGSRRILSAGMAILLSGFLMCPALGSYAGLFFGKILIGLGMGAVYVTCNTVSASGATQESSSAAFAGVAAGTISGIAAGAGLSSVFLSIGGWRIVYLAGAVFVFGGLLMAFSSPDIRLRKAESAQDRQDISTARFFLNRRIPLFFLLVLVPFLMTPSYRVYFFPIYAAEQGLGDVRVGQIYLLCGLLVLYLGPKLSSLVLKKMGSFYGVLFASFLAAGGLLLFVIFPGIGSVIAGVAIVYVAYAFGSVCQYTFFQLLPECLSYGSGKSMSVFSVFENLGMTLGPMVFGHALLFGYRAGVLIIAFALTVLTAAFAAFNWRSGKYFK